MPKAPKAIAIACFVVFVLLFMFQGEPEIADPPTGEGFMYEHPLLALLVGGLFLLWLLTSAAVTLYSVLAALLDDWADRKLCRNHLVTAGLALPGIIYFMYVPITDV